MTIYQATASAPVNIACIKYWGKRDTKLILPTNSSLSVTLDQDQLKSTTTARCDPSFEKDRLWLNGKEEEIKAGGRTDVCIKEMKRLREQLEKEGEPKVSREFYTSNLLSNSLQLSSYAVHICSRNNFPTAAGLASSASGFAALVSALAALYKLPQSPSELSLIARQGSGSACRSILGGFVAWEMGSQGDGGDSKAVEVAPQSHWSDLHALICVVSDEKKGTSSTSGMQRTVETSSLLQHRIKHVVPQRMKDISDAIRQGDFAAFAEITMADSNSFHAVCLDTFPPIFYLNDTSRALIALITEWNRASGETKGAYTFDAGPNCVVYVRKEHVRELVELVVSYFPQSAQFPDPYGLFEGEQPTGAVPAGFNEAVISRFPEGAVKSLIHTRVGDGPRTYGEEESLLGADGLPK